MPRQHFTDYINTFIDTPLETGLIRKGENWRVEMMVPHLEPLSPPALTLSLAVFRLKKNPNLNPSQLIEFSMEEARLLRDLLNRPEMVVYLEQE